jgi:serine/threonine protein kinase
MKSIKVVLASRELKVTLSEFNSTSEFTLSSWREFLNVQNALDVHTLHIQCDLGYVVVDVREICEVLTRITTLDEFAMTGAYFGDKGCEQIAEVLAEHECIRSVDLSSNGIGRKGCDKLATVLKTHNSLQRLNLSGNHRIGSDGSRVLLDALQTRVETFRDKQDFRMILRDCNLQRGSVLFRVAELMKDHACVELDLRFNKFPSFVNNVDLREKVLSFGARLQCEFHDLEPTPASVEIFQYEELKPIGKGAFGRVYDLQNGRALKQVVFTSRDEAKRFLHEPDVLSQLSHRNIVEFASVIPGSPNAPVINDGSCTLSFVMRKYDTNLHQYLKNNPEMSLQHRLDICVQISRGLAFLHGKKVVHRDLHSRNVFVNYRHGYVKVVIGDFGICRELGELVGENGMVTNSLPNYGIFAEILALECNHEKTKKTVVGPPTDMLAFGVLMWQILTLRDVLKDTAPARIMNLTFADWITHMTNSQEVQFNNIATVWDLMKLCLDPDRNVRPTAADALEILTETIQEFGGELPYPAAHQEENEKFFEAMHQINVLQRVRTDWKHCAFLFTGGEFKKAVTVFGIETSWEWLKMFSRENRTSGGVPDFADARYFWTVGPGPELFAISGNKVFFHDHDMWFNQTAAILSLS